MVSKYEIVITAQTSRTSTYLVHLKIAITSISDFFFIL